MTPHSSHLQIRGFKTLPNALCIIKVFCWKFLPHSTAFLHMNKNFKNVKRNQVVYTYMQGYESLNYYQF